MPDTTCPPHVSSRASMTECDACERVRAEFREMPGLTLTLPQASRLFNLDPLRCEQILTALVRAGQLSTNGRVFARSVS